MKAYTRMPQEIRDDMSRAEFEDFLDACRCTGAVDRDSDSMRLLPPDPAKFRLPIR